MKMKEHLGVVSYYKWSEKKRVKELRDTDTVSSVSDVY